MVSSCWWCKVLNVIQSSKIGCNMGAGGGGTPYSGLYGKALPKMGAFLHLQNTKGQGNLLFDYVKR